jgi:tetratricopeptide (TPR) repeat protein
MNLGNYASFLSEDRKDYDTAEGMYKRALEADPKDADNLGNYANFLSDVRKDHNAADAMYKRALEADPKNAANLGNYASFLSDVRKHYDAAEAMYKRALQADPKNAANLGNYANFISDVRREYDAAEAMYKRALQADPKDPYNYANLARLLLAEAKADGMAVLHQAIDLLRENPLPDVEIECSFYLFAHGTSSERPAALRKAKKLVESGIRSPGWDLSRNVERARLDGHAESAWLGKLASVINDEAEPEVLKGWPAWESAGA